MANTLFTNELGESLTNGVNWLLDSAHKREFKANLIYTLGVIGVALAGYTLTTGGWGGGGTEVTVSPFSPTSMIFVFILLGLLFFGRNATRESSGVLSRMYGSFDKAMTPMTKWIGDRMTQNVSVSFMKDLMRALIVGGVSWFVFRTTGSTNGNVTGLGIISIAMYLIIGLAFYHLVAFPILHIMYPDLYTFSGPALTDEPPFVSTL